MKAWREAATLIIAARNGIRQNQLYDYKLLFLKRQSKAKFAGAHVFPGGLIEPADADVKWQNLFKNHGHNESSFKLLFPNAKKRPIIFHTKENELPREISLRISAIRETFEECGILLCKKSSESTTISESTHHFPISDNELEFWQKKVYSDANEFYNMCEALQCYPNLWALHEWSNWLTPTCFPASFRYDSIFFFTCLPQIPNTKIDLAEIEDHIWTTPGDAINLLIKSLMPPQQYEVSRIAKYQSLDKLLEFAEKRSRNGIEMWLPVRVILQDGVVHLVPGDSMYPEKVDLYKSEYIDKSNMTLKEYRDASIKMHRLEMFNEPDKNNNVISKL